MRTFAAALLIASPTWADETDAFVEANILSIFYHELGHAVIDIEGLPVFAQEEDAADVFSILLIDAFWEPDAAENLAWHAASGFWAEAAFRDADGEEIAWWGVHSPDERRFYNTVCLFYGADPDARSDFAEELGLPEDRAETCPDEYDLAIDSWGPVLDEMAERGAGESFVMVDPPDSLSGRVIADEVTALNAEFSLSDPLTIKVEACDEANAFYDPEAFEVVFCTEFEAHLRDLAGLLEN